MGDTPIFLVGSGRSGSTFVARLVSHHPDLSYLTYLTRKYPARPYLTRFAMHVLSYPGGRSILRSRGEINEAWEFWERQAKGFTEPLRDLTESDLTPVARENLRHSVSDVIASSRPRFFAKFTGWSRIGYLKAAFPGARFIHLVRDGRDVASSFLRVSFWKGYRGPSNWRFGPLSVEDQRTWERHGRSFVTLAGLAWKLTTRSVEEARTRVPDGCIHQVRFEDFLEEPLEELRDMVEFSGLRWTGALREVVSDTEFRDPRKRFRDDLTRQQQEVLRDVLETDLHRYGYL